MRQLHFRPAINNGMSLPVNKTPKTSAAVWFDRSLMALLQHWPPSLVAMK